MDNGEGIDLLNRRINVTWLFEKNASQDNHDIINIHFKILVFIFLQLCESKISGTELWEH